MLVETLLWTWLVPALFALLHLTALILALVFYRRAPAACSLVLVASTLGLFINIGRPVVQTIWHHGPDNREGFAFLMFAFTAVGWIAYGLMIVAVFVGRNPPAPAPYRSSQAMDDSDDDWGRADIPPAKSGEAATGFQERK